MPARKPSSADRQAIDYCADQGLKVSARQLERWRQESLISTPERVREGFGGSVSAYATEELETVAEVARRLEACTVRAKSVMVRQWMFQDGSAVVDEWAIRNDILAVIDQVESGFGTGEPEDRVDSFVAAARRPNAGNPELRRFGQVVAQLLAELDRHGRNPTDAATGEPFTASDAHGFILADLARVPLGQSPADPELLTAWTNTRSPAFAEMHVNPQQQADLASDFTFDALRHTAANSPIGELQSVKRMWLSLPQLQPFRADLQALFISAEQQTPLQILGPVLLLRAAVVLVVHSAQAARHSPS